MDRCTMVWADDFQTSVGGKLTSDNYPGATQSRSRSPRQTVAGLQQTARPLGPVGAACRYPQQVEGHLDGQQ